MPGAGSSVTLVTPDKSSAAVALLVPILLLVVVTAGIAILSDMIIRCIQFMRNMTILYMPREISQALKLGTTLMHKALAADARRVQFFVVDFGSRF